MHLTDDDLTMMMTETLETMLGFELDDTSLLTGETFDLAAAVDIVSDDGPVASVVIQCDVSLATLLAQTLFRVTAEDIEPADISDALGEIANIVGGNVKGVLALDTTLTLPRVDPSGIPDVSHLDGVVGNRLAFTTRTHRIVASVFHAALVL